MNTAVILKSLFSAFITIFKTFSYLFIPFFIFLFFIFLFFIFYYFKFRFIDGITPILMEIPPLKKQNLFKTLFILFPKQLALDRLTLNPNRFKHYGIHIVAGEQGSGKTMTAVYLMQKWAAEAPRLKIYTNMCYKHENGELNNLNDLLSHENGIYGVVNCIDEIHTWFSTKENKNIPGSILSEISQQRKQTKAIVGTVQVFSQLAKAFRSQTHYVYKPITILGCLTIVRMTKAKYYDSEMDKFKKYNGFFIFAHTKELRDSYNTYMKISKYKNTEFDVANSSIIAPPTEVPTPQGAVPVVVDKDVAKKLGFK